VTTTASSVSRAPRPSSLADVLDLILDKGLVIDAYVRVSALGIEVLTIDARIVVASVDTYLHFAEAVNRLDIAQTEMQGIPGFVESRSGGDGADQGDGSSDRRERGEDQRALKQGRGERRPASRQSLASRIGERGRWNG
jgi:hypothetical protein